MSAAHTLRFEPKVVLEHRSAQGALVTDLRGILITGTTKLLKDANHLEQYEAALSDSCREQLRHLLAASWAPSELVSAHFAAIDQLELSSAQTAHMGELIGTYIVDSSFASMIRSARSLGAESGLWFCFKQADRVWKRIYQGGGLTITQLGPKDARIEVHGLRFAPSRSFRVMHAAFIRALVMLVAKACVIRPEPSARGASDRFSVSLSWV